jgi:hypothetical protein
MKTALAVLLVALCGCDEKPQQQEATAAIQRQPQRQDVPATTQPQPQKLACDPTAAHNFISLASDGDEASLMRVDEDGHLFYIMKHKAWIGLQPKTDPRFGTLAFALYTAEACTSGTVRQVDFFNWEGKHVARVGPGGVTVD